MSRWLTRWAAAIVLTMAMATSPVAALPAWIQGTVGDVINEELSTRSPTLPKDAGPITAAPPADPSGLEALSSPQDATAKTHGARQRPGRSDDAVFTVDIRGSMFGVSWAKDEMPEPGTPVWVRTHGAKGWSAWTEISVSGLTDPAQRGETRYGTEPLWAPGSDRVQVRVSREVREQAKRSRLTAITPTADPVRQSARGVSIHTTFITRAGWGADESLRNGCGPDYSDTTQAIIVHHTAESNDYSVAESAGVVRSIYYYHAKVLGWCDIGYNALVDKYGQVFEGRLGGIDRPVWGAQALGFNYNTYGVSVLGNYQTASLSGSAFSALVGVLARRSYLYRLNPLGTTVLTSGDDGTKFPKGTSATLPVISGHRDTNFTSCPGDNIYGQLPVLRQAVAQALLTPTAGPPWRTTDADGDGTTDILALDGKTSTVQLAASDVFGNFRSLAIVGSGAGWDQADTFLTAGDTNHDATPDLLVRFSGGNLVLYGTGSNGSPQNGRVVGTGWQGMTAIVAAGPQTRGGLPYVMGRDSVGDLYLYTGDGNGGFFSGRTQIGMGWNSMDLILGGNDVTGDGIPDVIARRATDGALLLYGGYGEGRITFTAQIGSGWQGFRALSLVSSPAQGNAIVGVLADGTVRRYPFQAGGRTFAPSFVAATGWQNLSLVW